MITVNKIETIIDEKRNIYLSNTKEIHFFERNLTLIIANRILDKLQEDTSGCFNNAFDVNEIDVDSLYEISLETHKLFKLYIDTTNNIYVTSYSSDNTINLKINPIRSIRSFDIKWFTVGNMYDCNLLNLESIFKYFIDALRNNIIAENIKYTYDPNLTIDIESNNTVSICKARYIDSTKFDTDFLMLPEIRNKYGIQQGWKRWDNNEYCFTCSTCIDSVTLDKIDCNIDNMDLILNKMEKDLYADYNIKKHACGGIIINIQDSHENKNILCHADFRPEIHNNYLIYRNVYSDQYIILNIKDASIIKITGLELPIFCDNVNN
jgi:hypothetical protein